MPNIDPDTPRTPADAPRERLLALLRRDPDQPLRSLSPDQGRIWLLQGLNPEVPLHVFGAASIEGPLDPQHLRRAAEEVVRRHVALRSAFLSLGRGPVRLAAATVAVPIRFLASDGADEQRHRQQLEEVARDDARRPFDLRTPPLLRISVVSNGPDRHTLLLTLHQIVADIFAPARFIRQVLSLTQAWVSGRPAGADEGGVTAEQEAAGLDAAPSGDTAERVRFWRAYLEDAPVLQLPIDVPRPPVRTHRGAEISCEVEGELLTRLRDTSAERGISMTALTLAAFQMLLSWYTSQDDIVVGVPVGAPAGPDAIGPLAHTGIVRTRFVGDPDVHDVLGRVSDGLQTAARHGLPLACLIDELKPARDLSRTPLFQAFFVGEERAGEAWRLGPPDVKRLDLHPGLAMFDLTLTARLEERMRLSLEYNCDVLRAATAQQMLADLRRVLGSIATPPRRFSRILVQHGGAREAGPARRRISSVHAERPVRCLHELVLGQADRTPDAAAVSAGMTHLTYGALNRRARRLAAFLRQHGIGPESTVGVCLADKTQTVATILGVLHSGGACVPLDPQLPVERIAFMVRDARIRMVLTDAGTSGHQFDTMTVPLDQANADGPGDEPGVVRASLDNLAYVIYTSGSTGRPKGVAVSHRSIVNNLEWRQRTWPLTTTDRVLQNYSFSFDPSMWATWWPLLAGACVVFPPSGGYFDSRALARVMVDERVTVYGAAPSLHAVLLQEPMIEDCTSLRHVFSGGEVLDGPLQALVRQRLPRASLWNVYGPTEATIDCSYGACPPVPTPGAAPIGLPIANTTVYALNRHLATAPPGVSGEIHVGGVALARGYIGDPALTAEKFRPDPFAADGGRMYRTGDLGRYRPPHGFEFIGRGDDQVKVRGFRIELGEIERALLSHTAVREAAVVVRKGSGVDTRIVAYAVLQAEAADRAWQTELATFLAARLPEYMIPDAFVTMDGLPRTTSGKVDRQALPELAEAPGSAGFRAPRDTLETEIARIVGDVLGVASVSIDADLFELGCNSLLIARVASRLSHAYRIELPVQQMFRDPTVAGIAALVERFQRGLAQDVMVHWTLSQLEAEAELPAEITPDGLPPYQPERVRRVLITGATGYLGAFILERLLQDTDIECECLVRAETEVHARERLREVMARYRIWSPRYASRIHLVLGDVAKARLGLSAEEFGRIAQRVDAIYHCAALVNFVYPYSALRQTNVIGTREVLRLASTARRKAVHYISTVDVLLGTHMERPFLETDDVLRHPPEIPDGYARSKWVAEKMLAQACDRGVPTTVYRPGLIMGHTATGATQTNDYLLIGLKGYLDLGVLPEPGILIDFVPVDFVARAIVHLSRRPDSTGRFFHIWNPRTVHMSEAYEWIRSFGYPLEAVPGPILRDKVLKEVDVSNALYPFVPIFRAMRDDPPPSPHHPSILGKVNILEECANTFQGLADSGIDCPPLTEALAHLCFSYLVSVDFLPEPGDRVAIHA